MLTSPRIKLILFSLLIFCSIDLSFSLNVLISFPGGRYRTPMIILFSKCNLSLLTSMNTDSISLS